MMDRFSRENTLSDGNPSVGQFVELFVNEWTNVITGKPYSKINSRRMLKHQVHTYVVALKSVWFF